MIAQVCGWIVTVVARRSSFPRCPSVGTRRGKPSRPAALALRVALLIDPVRPIDFEEGLAMQREAKRLLGAAAEISLAAKRFAKKPDRTVLEVAIEVDEDIPARHDLHLGEDAVGGEAVIG